MVIAILAVVGGATGWEDIELYAESHQEWLGSFLDLRNGVPRADTYRRVFERLSPEALQQCFLGWVAQVVEQTGAEVIPIDGKSITRLLRPESKAVRIADGECLGKFTEADVRAGKGGE